MNTGLILTAIAIITFIVLVYMFVKQLMKLIAILLTMFIIFAGYVYIKNGSLPGDINGYLNEGKIALQQLHQGLNTLIQSKK